MIRQLLHLSVAQPVTGHWSLVQQVTKGAITSKIKHAVKQVLQDLRNCCTTVAALVSILFYLAANDGVPSGLDGTPSLTAS